MLRTLPSLRLGREAEERAQSSTGGTSGHYSYTYQGHPVQSVSSTEPRKNIPSIPTSTSTKVNTSSMRPVQPVTRTEKGLWSTKEPFMMSIDNDGRKHIRFPHCSELTFPSMQYAFDYFQVQGKLYDQRVLEQRRPKRVAQQGLQAAQTRPQMAQQLEHLSLRAAQLAEALYPSEPVWQFNTPLKPTDVQYVVKLPTKPSHSASDSQYHEAESFNQNQWKEPDSTHSSSRSSPPEPPPQTLFAESTPHAQEIQAWPRVKLPVKGLQSWPFQPRVTKDSSFPQPASSTQLAEETLTLSGSHHQPSSCIGTVLPQTLINEVDIFDQPPSHLMPSSYADTALPQTLDKKDRRILGVSSTAGIDGRFPPTPITWTSLRLITSDKSPIILGSELVSGCATFSITPIVTAPPALRRGQLLRSN